MTTPFAGTHYEKTNGVATKYYGDYPEPSRRAGMQRVAMRSGSTLSYLLSDHLGSTSLVVKDTITGVWANDVVSELRYKPWGETRYASGATPTKYQFTGQFSYASDFGLLFYNARWYDPAIGRFISADSIVPGGVQGLDRYAYVNNAPLRYTDPSGHSSCDYEDGDGNCKAYTEADYKNSYLKLIKDRYKWNVKGNDWTLKELELLYQTGQDIESYIDGLTGGKGLAWMNAYLGGTTFQHGGSHQTLPGWIPGIRENTIFLAAGKYNAQTIAHELGHVWDINTSDGICLCGASGGVADDLNTWIGGNITSGRFQKLRFLNWDGKSPDADIQSANILGMLELVRFDDSVNNGYGNGSTADYLAESFSWNVINRQKVPIAASVWVDQTIIAQAAGLP